MSSPEMLRARHRRMPHATNSRFAWAALGLTALASLLIARALTPDPHGHGTHIQLGLPPCAFLAWTGLPCPLCGLTTSFAYMARGSLTSAVMSHPLGAPLFALTVFAVPACAAACLRATPIVGAIDRFHLQRWALSLVGIVALVWLARLWL